LSANLIAFGDTVDSSYEPVSLLEMKMDFTNSKLNASFCKCLAESKIKIRDDFTFVYKSFNFQSN
jgi:hypothetical protein